MNCGQQSIRLAAHVGAQKAAFELADSYNYDASVAKKRSIVKDHLAEAGFSRMIINTDENEGRTPKPLASGRSGDGESWYDWAVFDRAEVQAYLDYIEGNDNTPILKDGDECLECGHPVHMSRDHDAMMCPDLHCRELYNYREDHALLSRCEGMFGSYYYGGPGRAFNEEPHAHITKRGTRILVKQYGGLDV